MPRVPPPSPTAQATESDAAATACTPSRTTLFTGQYASLHGVADTDGLAKQATDPAMHFLDPDTVPTMGDWFRAGGALNIIRQKQGL